MTSLLALSTSPAADLARAVDEYWAGPFGNLTRVAIVVVVAIVIRIVLHFVIRAAVNRIVHHHDKRASAAAEADVPSPVAAARTVQRAQTLGSVLSNIVSVVLTVVVLIIAITVLLPNASSAFALITAALGAGLGFGAQNIIKDVLNGLFMVVEDQLGVGDVIDTGFATGVVERVGIRITQVRDVNGVLWFVRNGEILRVGNMSLGWSRLLVDLPVPYDADIESVKTAILKTAVDMSKEAEWKTDVLEEPTVWGIESVSAEAIVLRLVVKTRAGKQHDFGRELRGRLKRTLDGLGLAVPSVVPTMFTGPAN